jgi:hypothetical protein
MMDMMETTQVEVGRGSNLPLAPVAHPAEAPIRRIAASRLDAVAALATDPQVCRQVGAAWPLWLHLLLRSEGRIEGTCEEIGIRLGVSGRTVRSWAGILSDAGIATGSTRGRRMGITLVGRHLDAAEAESAEAVVVSAPESPESPKLQALRKVAEAADQAGSPLEIRMVIR